MGNKRNYKPYRHTTNYYRVLKKLRKADVINLPVQDFGNIAIVVPTQDSTTSDQCTTNEFSFHDIGEPEEYTVQELAEEALSSKLSLFQELREWALLHKVTLSCVNDLLKVLRAHGCNELPKDARTLLSTPSTCEITEMGAGKFWYNGISTCLQSSLHDIKEDMSISLIVNVDGMSPFHSSILQLWPILFKIGNMPHIQPMVAAIYYGQGKPPLHSYLIDFVQELNEIIKDGVYINGQKITIGRICFVCDTQARSFIKGTPGSNAENGSCIKCTVIGEWDKKGRHMSYPRTHCSRRTDQTFRHKLDEDHHKEDTPLTKLPIDMIASFIVADSLHLFDLGIMRRCLLGWREGSYNFRTKFSKYEADQVSEMLENCNSTKPLEIQRAIRGLKFLKFWKGSEYRTFLLYLGPVVLKDFLPQETYDHFLLLSSAVTILSCKTYLKYIDIAERLLEEYIEKFIEIYGADSISSNIHNLCHVVDDVRMFGVLSEISSYPFENFLRHLKCLIRSGNVPLSQISRRVMELSKLSKTTASPEYGLCLKGEIPREQHQLSTCKGVYKELNLAEKFTLKADNNNNYFMTTAGEIVAMINATNRKGKVYIYGYGIQDRHNFFSTPFASSQLNIYIAKGKMKRTSNGTKCTCKYGSPKLYSVDEVKCKLFCMQYHMDFVFYPLLHTLDINIKN